jgi:hypothetical protein
VFKTARTALCTAFTSSAVSSEAGVSGWTIARQSASSA